MPDSVGQVPLLVMFGRCPMGLCRQFVLLGCSSVCLMHTVISRANRQFEVCTGTPNRSTPVFTARRRQPMTSHGQVTLGRRQACPMSCFENSTLAQRTDDTRFGASLARRGERWRGFGNPGAIKDRQ